MTTAVTFTVISAVFLAVFAGLGILNIARAGSNMFNADSDPFEDIDRTFKRHGLFAVGSTVSGIATIGGIIWIFLASQ